MALDEKINALRNRKRARTNGRSSYDNVQRLLEGFRMGKHFRYSVCLGQRIFGESLESGHLILELLVDRDKFLIEVSCSQLRQEIEKSKIPFTV
jgi:hypothetical protein